MEMLDSKRCLFCDMLVHVKHKGGCDWYAGCHCSPSGAYGLRDGSFEPFNRLSYEEKRGVFPLLSAYIREQSDCEARVVIAFEELQAILQSPDIPLTMEEKGMRLLRYLHRHASGPNDPVAIPALAQSYNLTYSPNLQEFVFIAEQLKDEGVIERLGATFKLTEKGWAEAEATAAGKQYKPCFVLAPSDDPEFAQAWKDNVFPRLLQLGYAPQWLNAADGGRAGQPLEASLERILTCKLLIADITSPCADTWLYAGYALGNEVQAIWTCRSESAADKPDGVRPIEWDDAEQLADRLQSALSRAS